MTIEWHTHLCEYYQVTPEKALELGTRSSGRKPDLPGSETCKPVSGKTFEDIWAEKERKDTQSVFDFYKDQGAWSTFRQCVRHKDFEKLHIAYYQYLAEKNVLRQGSHLCEYGAGVAPFTTTFLKYLSNTMPNLTITIVDVDCEHFNFAKYRLNKIKEERGLSKIELIFETVEPNKLPTFKKKLDALFCFEVLEHTPSPADVINNIKDSMSSGGYYIENFIKHKDMSGDGPDLVSAKKERSKYYQILDQYYNIAVPEKYNDDNPNITRIWQRNSL